MRLRSSHGLGVPMPPERTPVYTNRLQCVECGRVSRENERGWKARLTVDDEVVVYCVRRAGIFQTGTPALLNRN
jgi:hypothetical protein